MLGNSVDRPLRHDWYKSVAAGIHSGLHVKLHDLIADALVIEVREHYIFTAASVQQAIREEIVNVVG